MGRRGLATLVEPDRVLVVRADTSTRPSTETRSVPGVGVVTDTGLEELVPGKTAVTTAFTTAAEIPGAIDGGGDLLVLDLPGGEVERLLQSFDEIGPGAVILPRDAKDGLPGSLRPTIETTDTPVLGPGASIWVPKSERSDVGEDGTTPTPRAVDKERTAVVVDDGDLASTIATLTLDAGAALGPVVGLGTGSNIGFGEMAAHLAERAGVGLVLGRATDVRAEVVESVRGATGETPVGVFPSHGPVLATGQAPEIPGQRLSEAVLDQAGTVPVDSLERLVDGAPALANQPVPDPQSVVVVSNAGGPGVMAIDAVGASGLDVARLSDATVERLETVIPDHGSARNPLDLLADSGLEVFEAALDATLDDENVGAAVVLSAPSALFSFERLADIIVEARRRHELPIVTALMGGSQTHDAAARLRTAGITNYFDPYRAVGALELLRRHADALPKRRREPTTGTAVQSGDVLQADAGATTQLAGDEAATFLRRLGVDGVEETGGRGASEDSGGGVAGGESGTPVVEMFVEGVRTPERGPLVVTGVETFAETVGDASVRAAPLAEADAREMLAELRAAPLLSGARGGAAADTESVVESLVAVSALLSRDATLDRVSIPRIAVWESGMGVESVRLERATD
jgi:acetyltransferase